MNLWITNNAFGVTQTSRILSQDGHFAGSNSDTRLTLRPKNGHFYDRMFVCWAVCPSVWLWYGNIVTNLQITTFHSKTCQYFQIMSYSSLYSSYFLISRKRKTPSQVQVMEQLQGKNELLLMKVYQNTDGNTWIYNQKVIWLNAHPNNIKDGLL